MSWHQDGMMLAEVAGAMLLGGVIGLERELARKPSGLRTHMLVAGSAALFVALADLVLDHFHARSDTTYLKSDILRILSAIVTGVSFLGAGTILRGEHGTIQGLTTAASFLFTSGVGVCVALHHFELALGATLLTVFVLHAIPPLEKRLARRQRDRKQDKDESGSV